MFVEELVECECMRDPILLDRISCVDSLAGQDRIPGGAGVCI